MFFGCAVNGEPMNGAEQDWPMKNDEQCKDYPNRNPNATPPFPRRPGIFLLIIFHEHFILWTALERATMRRAKHRVIGYQLSVISLRLTLAALFPTTDNS